MHLQRGENARQFDAEAPFNVRPVRETFPQNRGGLDHRLPIAGVRRTREALTGARRLLLHRGLESSKPPPLADNQRAQPGGETDRGVGDIAPGRVDTGKDPPAPGDELGKGMT